MYSYVNGNAIVEWEIKIKQFPYFENVDYINGNRCFGNTVKNALKFIKFKTE